jgi:hypothetical protein
MKWYGAQLMTAAVLPTSLLQLLGKHSPSYAPHYPPSDNSDHGPMACLAMHGLGIDWNRIEEFANRYSKRLVASSPAQASIRADDWENHIGRRESYLALVKFFESEIIRDGWETVEGRYLPRLMSGWVKDAFHPLIRLGYGIEFNGVSEIAAGLAYLVITGDDPRLASIATRTPLQSADYGYLKALQSMRDPAFAQGSFNSRYRRIGDSAAVHPTGGSPKMVMRDVTRECLEVFHATHDFFALHLVTGSHAFLVCAPWAGPESERVYSAGIAIAYLAIGAPDFNELPHASAVLPIAEHARLNDEHDIKIAYTCQSLAKAYSNPTYTWSAVQYLTPRLGGSA